jgi:hypothetical protein
MGKVTVTREQDLTEENLLEEIEYLKRNIKETSTKNTEKLPQEIIYEEIIKCIKY